VGARDRTEQSAPDGQAKQAPIGWVRLRQHFIDPVRKNVEENAAAGVVAALATLLGGDEDAPPSDSGAGPSRALRRARLLALGVLGVLALVFLARGLLS
jgi:hypothetical protein